MLLLVTFAISVSTLANTPFKNFDHAMIFNGFGPNSAAFIGSYTAAVERGEQPDLIIASCGGAIAATLIRLFPDPNDLQSLIQSKAFHRILMQMQPSDYARPITDVFPLLFDILQPLGKLKRFPEIFTHFLLDFPQDPVSGISLEGLSAIEKDLLIKLTLPIAEGPGPDVILISSKLKFTRSQQKQRINKVFPDRKFLTETWIATPKAAMELNKHPRTSDIAKAFPESHLFPNSEIKTDWRWIDAIRASVPEPFVMQPLTHKDGNYATGTVNAIPIEIASRISKNVTYQHRKRIDVFQDRALKQLTGYSFRKRQLSVAKLDVRYAIDFSDFIQLNRKERITFYPNLQGLRFWNGIPKDLNLFQERSQKLFDLGYGRMVESMRYPNSRSHLRNQ